MRDEIGRTDDIVKRIDGQIQALEVELMAPPRIKPLEETVVADDGDKRMKITGAGFCGAFALVVLGVAFLEFRARRVNCSDDVARGLQIRLMGTLPVLPKRARHTALVHSPDKERYLHNLLVESVDPTRLVLVHASRLEALRVLMITSAFAAEGKTMLSSHLAANLARSGHRTLLIDGDLRRPAVHKVFNQPGQPGFGEVLTGEVDMSEAVQPGPLEGLWILPAGKCKQQPAQLLARRSIGTLFQKLKEQYDYIIVDSAPVLPVADTQVIGQHVDGVILSVRRDVSRLHALHEAYERLAMLKIRILGAVLHGTSGRSYGSSYSYSYHATQDEDA